MVDAVAGVRSYQATEYGGVDAALDVVRSSKADVVWGHSRDDPARLRRGHRRDRWLAAPSSS